MKRRIAAGALAVAALGSGAVFWLLRRPLALAWDIWRAGRAMPEEIAARQRTRLAALVAFARKRSAYYRALYRSLPAGDMDLAALPIVTKPELMAHFDEWVTDPQVTKAGVEAFVADPATIGERFLGRYCVWTTSGTTGRPGIFVHDPEAMRLYYTLGLMRALSIMHLFSRRHIVRLLRRGSRNALLAVTGGHFVGAAEIERLQRRAPWLAKSVRIVSVLQPLPSVVRALNEFQPTRVGGYPSALILLADEQLAGRLHIHPAMLTPVGEGLAPAGRAKLERVFGCPVYMGYSASEFMGIGFECEQGWMHINSDWLIIEPVDAAYRPVPPGQPSHTVLLTNLANRVQPLIRYDLGDSITVRPDPCSCGCRLPAIRVEGRKGDILYWSAPSGEAVALLPLAVGTVIEETPGVRRAQVLQTGRSTLTVRLELGDSAAATAQSESAARAEVWDGMERRLREYLTAQGLPSVTIVRAPELPQQDPVSGKYREVWSEV
ncbi:MAG TPA: phenylacetate--CoA ligase family protein [Ktedonobacterales bacterium]|nr:phenylacetate--CoA ligase family protein [Ktedonobacterales bacterium]